MNVVLKDDVLNKSEVLKEVIDVLENDGVVCLPSDNTYRLAVNGCSEDAIMYLLQAKRRVSKKPSLMFIPDESYLNKVAKEVSEKCIKLIRHSWDKPVTIRLPLSDNYSKNVAKAITGGTGKIGVRIPTESLVKRILSSYNKPLFITSANLTGKVGSTSIASIKKNFSRIISVLIDDGDLLRKYASTIVDFKGNDIDIVRPGAISEEELLAIF
ncbi:MAG: L-threonylcarbamoyladenylate synthase [Pseudomonadota bacterium]